MLNKMVAVEITLLVSGIQWSAKFTHFTKVNVPHKLDYYVCFYFYLLIIPYLFFFFPNLLPLLFVLTCLDSILFCL